MAKKSFMERTTEKIQEELASGIPLKTVLRHHKMGLITVNNGVNYRRLMVLAKSLDFLELIGQLYIKDPKLLMNQAMKKYFDNLRVVDENLTKLSDLYYSDEFKEIRELLFEKTNKNENVKEVEEDSVNATEVSGNEEVGIGNASKEN